MEISTLIGLVFGVICVIVSIFWGGGNPIAFGDAASVFIVFGGLISAMMIAYPMSTLSNVGKLIGLTLKKQTIDFSAEIEKILSIANIARREGILALEQSLSDIDDPFMTKGIMLIVDGSDQELVRDILETDLSFVAERHSQGQAVLNMASSLSPAYGMIGTLIGLIIMLGKLDDPSSLGPGMAVALITTFYGCILANLIFSPMAKKLGVYSSQEQLRKEMLIEGMIAIQNGENPRIIREKLVAYLNSAQIKLAPPDSKGGEDSGT